jgi:S1-C subfamily serine protease
VDRLIADYEKADLVALHISDLPVPPLTIHRGGLPEIGTDVYVLGSPEGLSFTFSNGLISAVRANPHDSKLVWLQMTAPISHGSSGGPVLDENAEVIAVSVAVLESGQNLNFAVPAKYIRALLGDW